MAEILTSRVLLNDDPDVFMAYIEDDPLVEDYGVTVDMVQYFQDTASEAVMSVGDETIKLFQEKADALGGPKNIYGRQYDHQVKVGYCNPGDDSGFYPDPVDENSYLEDDFGPDYDDTDFGGIIQYEGLTPSEVYALGAEMGKYYINRILELVRDNVTPL